MSMIAKVTLGSFERDVLNSDMPALVEFAAPWCSSCRAMEKTLEALAPEYEGKARFFQVDVDAEGALRERHDIYSVPALFLYINGEIARKKIGLIPRDELIEFIDIG